MAGLDSFVPKTTEVELGGKKYKFAELTLADFALFRARVVEQRDAVRGKRRDRLLIDAEKIGGVDPVKLLEQLDRPPTEEEVEAEMETVEGIGFMAYLSLKHSYPEVTLDKVMQMIAVSSAPNIAIALMGSPDKKKPAPATRPKK